MKPLHGLILAIGLGIAAGMFNFAYLNLRGKDVKKVDFIGVKPGVTIGRGDRLTKGNLAKVGIPKAAVGNLDQFAILWDKVESVEGEHVWRTLSGSALLLADDLRTPPQELKLDKDERALWIPVDNRRFVPSLVIPGDRVSFIVTKSRRPTRAYRPLPTSASDPDGELEPVPDASMPPMLGGTEIIGPFTILSLGNRLGSPGALQAARIRQSQENVMTIRVKVDSQGKLEAKADKLLNMLHATNFGALDVLLHDRHEQ